MPERFAVAVTGAGQAGLVTSHHLTVPGIERVVHEHGRVGETWPCSRWDSFTLVTPNWTARLPGHPLRARSRWLHAVRRSSVNSNIKQQLSGEGGFRLHLLSQATREDRK